MKQIICIALLITLPFLVFAQEYSLTLKGTRDRVVCDILGAANGYLYYQTATQSMVVVPVANVKTLYQGRNDLAPRLQNGMDIPFNSEILAYLPTVPDSVMAQQDTNMLQRTQVDALKSMSGALKVISGCMIIMLGINIYALTKASI
jgi:hypothetical protein